MKIGMIVKNTEENNEKTTEMTTTSKKDKLKSFVKRNKKKIIIGGLTAVGAFALKCVISGLRGDSSEDVSEDVIETTYVDEEPEETTDEE